MENKGEISSYFSRKVRRHCDSYHVSKKIVKIDVEAEKNAADDSEFPVVIHLTLKKTIKDGINIEYGVIFSKYTADIIYSRIEEEIVYDKNSQVKIFGKTFDVPRKQTAFGDEGLTYTFSGVTVPARSWNHTLIKMKNIVEKLCKQKFNFVLVNRYKDGEDYMGEHQDNEKDLDLSAPIASLSFGQPRDFIFKHKTSRSSYKKEKSTKISNIKFVLEHGSLLVMYPPTNNHWYHSLPRRSVNSHPNPRINFTFRKMNV